MSDWSCPKCNLRSGQTCADRECPGLAKAVGQAFRTQRSSAGGEAMSDISPRRVVELATRVHGSKKRGYAFAGQELGVAWDTCRKIDGGETPGSKIPTDVVQEAFDLFRQQRITQLLTELEQLEKLVLERTQ